MNIPIIFYHKLFNRSDNDKYSIDRNEFKKQMEFLLVNDFKPVLIEDLFKQQIDINDGKKRIIITFDDGSYSDFSIAYPLLKEYGFIATFFITGNWVGTEHHVTWLNLEEMTSNGMSIQSHGLTHVFLSDLSKSELLRELRESKRMLEMKLNRSVDFLSLPGGAYSRHVLIAAESVGYRGICTSRPGLLKSEHSADGCTVFNRFLITRQTSFDDFKAIVNGTLPKIMQSKLKYFVSSNLRRMIGTKTYYAIWSRFLKRI